MKSNNATTNCTSKQKRITSDLLLKIYMNARHKAYVHRPVRTHYNYNTFG